MLLTNQWLDKLAASCADFIERGMLVCDRPPPALDLDDGEDEDGGAVDGECVMAHVVLACTQCVSVLMHTVKVPNNMIVECNYPWQLAELVELINEPALPSLTKLFVYHQLQSESTDESDASSVPDFHEIKLTSLVSVFHSATTTFYAPSDQSGIHGMQQERI